MKRGLFRFMVALCFCMAFASSSYSQNAAGLNGKFGVKSRWKGFDTHAYSDGHTLTYDAVLVVTARNGNDFEGEYRLENGNYVHQVKGTINNKNVVTFTFVKTTKQKVELKNVAGMRATGKLTLNKGSKKPELRMKYDWLKVDGKNLDVEAQTSLTADE